MSGRPPPPAPAVQARAPANGASSTSATRPCTRSGLTPSAPEPARCITPCGAAECSNTTSRPSDGKTITIRTARPKWCSSYGIQQGFLTGTSLQLGMGNTLGVTQNSPYNLFTPYSQSTLQLAVQQNLLQGFRPSVNNRAIRVAKNQRHISDLTFKNQVMSSVANVVSLYWDLVTDNEDLKVKQHTFELNKKLYEDNQRRAELGAIAPIDIIQAEAEMKSSQQDVVTAELQVLQQEMILKSVLTRSGMDDLAVVGARIVPTDHIEVPAQEAVRPIQDLMAEALAGRPDVEQSAVGLEDARITTLGVKDAMLPQLTGFATFSNSGLAGQINGQGVPTTLANGQTVLAARADVG